MANLQEAARRMYSAQGFRDYGKILGEGFKQAGATIAANMAMVEGDAKKEREERERKLERIIGNEPKYNEGGVPEAMRPAVTKYLQEQKNLYYELGNQLVEYNATEPEYRDIVEQMNQVQNKFINLDGAIKQFTTRADDYRAKGTIFSSLNDEVERNLVSEVYSEQFSNFSILDDELVVETSQGVQSLNDIHQKYESFAPKAAKEMNSLLSVVDDAQSAGLGGKASYSPDMIKNRINAILKDEDSSVQLENKQSLALDPGYGDDLGESFIGWVSNSGRVINEETMDIDGDGMLDKGWIMNAENEGSLTEMLVDYHSSLAQNGFNTGRDIYKKDNPGEGEEIIDTSKYLNKIASARKDSIVQVDAPPPKGFDNWEDFNKANPGAEVPENVTGGISEKDSNKNLVYRLMDDYNKSISVYPYTNVIQGDDAFQIYFQNQTGAEIKGADGKTAITREEARDKFNKRYGESQMFTIDNRNGLTAFRGDISDDQAIYDFLVEKELISKADLYTK